jgi:hydroxypyruvate reductase
MTTVDTLGRQAREIFCGALRRLDPAALVMHHLRGSAPPGRVFAIALGKAAAGMAAGARATLGDALCGGLLVAPAGAPPVPGFTTMFGAHPEPDADSERAGRAVLAQVAGLRQVDCLLALVSGGASALAAVPCAGITLQDKVAAVRALGAAGAPIGEINAVRKHLSALKGGQLAAASPVPVVTLVASDVVGDDLAVVGSGPTVPDPSRYADAIAAIVRRCGWDAVPPVVREVLFAGARGERAETPALPRPEDRAELVAGLGALVAAGVAAAAEQGFAAEALSSDLSGDVSEVADLVATAAFCAADLASTAGTPVCLVAGGEPTVTLPPQPGVGGRAQQLALHVAQRIAGLECCAVLVAGSDGIDGASEAAGAVVDGTTWAALAAAGVDAPAALARCDAGAALSVVSATLQTGRTGVNHADLVVIAVAPAAARTTAPGVLTG